MISQLRKSALPVGLALVAASCQDLNVVNPNRPDAARATSQPITTETFVATSFRTWWPVGGHDDYPSWAFSTMAREITSGFADFGQLELSAEPRVSWNNSPVNARRAVAETPWYGLYRTISTANDVVAAVDRGLVIENATRTARSKAMGKFMQGLSYGYASLYFDKGPLIDEKTRLDTIRTPEFIDYKALNGAAIGFLDAAITTANSQPTMTFPVESWMFQALTKDQFVRLANSFAARLLVYQARSRTERAAVNWAEVIRRVDAGIQTDFAPQAQPDILFDDWKRLIARTRNSRPSDFGRPSYWLIGPADSTDGWKNWVSTPNDSRVAFQMRTKDRRIQGATGPTSLGKYVGYNQNNIFDPNRGTYRWSHYFYRRNGVDLTYQTGPQVAMTVVEMDLLKAEALIRLGRASEAVPLINKSRVANGELPPVTVDGPPNEAGCVPRKQNGTCGSLWDALRYEKGIEGLGVSGVIAFFDARGWQTLPENTPVQLPIPGRELQTLQLPLYTFGGPGGQSSSPLPDPERCPVALARCAP